MSTESASVFESAKRLKPMGWSDLNRVDVLERDDIFSPFLVTEKQKVKLHGYLKSGITPTDAKLVPCNVIDSDPVGYRKNFNCGTQSMVPDEKESPQAAVNHFWVYRGMVQVASRMAESLMEMVPVVWSTRGRARGTSFDIG